MSVGYLEECSRVIHLFKNMSSLLFLFVPLTIQPYLCCKLVLQPAHWIPDFSFGADPMQISTLVPPMGRSRYSKVVAPGRQNFVLELCSVCCWVLLANFLFNAVCHTAAAMGCYLRIVGFHSVCYKNLILTLRQCRGHLWLPVFMKKIKGIMGTLIEIWPFFPSN